MEYNPYGMQALWSQGDLVIKIVALLLLLMSIVTWYLILTRIWRAVSLSRAARATGGFWHAQNFSEGLNILNQGSRSTAFLHLAEQGQGGCYSL